MKAVKARILDQTHLELSQPLPDVRDDRIEILVPTGETGESVDAPARNTDHAARSSSTEGALEGTRLREREDAWVRSHPEVVRRYAGQWLVVEGERVVAHGKDPAQLVKEAWDQGVRIPYVFYVETPRAGVVRLGL